MSNPNKNKKIKITVTGSTGMVGSHLVSELLCQGYENIHLPVRSQKSVIKLHKTLKREGIEELDHCLDMKEGSLNDPHFLADNLKGCDILFSCAATVSIGGVDRDELIRDNVDIIRNLTDAAINARVKKIIHVSSIAAIGESVRNDGYIDEQAIITDSRNLHGYGASKLFCEKEIWRAREAGINVVILNPATILGSSDWKSGSSVIIPVLNKCLLVYTNGVTAYVDVKDVARVMVMLMDTDKGDGERYILASENISYRKLITYANRSRGKIPPFIRIATSVPAVAEKMSWLFSRLTGRKQFLTKEISLILFSKKYYDGSKIQQIINFEYTPIKSTIERVMEEYRNEQGE